MMLFKTMSPRKSEEDVMIKFCKSLQGQKQSFADVSSKFLKFHRKKPVVVSILNKVVGLKACYFIKIIPVQVFSCEISQIFEEHFFTECLRSRLLAGVCKWTSLVKTLHSSHFNIFGMNHRWFRKMTIKKNNE